MRILPVIALVACACNSKPARHEQSHAFMVKVADALEEDRQNCPKLAVALMRLEPDAHALRSALDKAGKRLHDYVADKPLQDRFFREPNPLSTCADNAQFQKALAATWLYVEHGDSPEAHAKR